MPPRPVRWCRSLTRCLRQRPLLHPSRVDRLAPSPPRPSELASSLPPAGQNGRLASSSSSSSTRWKARRADDAYSREARVQGLKSRAAFKLLQVSERFAIFRAGQTVVDLGYAPGSWSQVALDRTQPGGRVLGIDVIPAQPPRGVSAIQGNFLSPSVREEAWLFLLDPDRGRPRRQRFLAEAQHLGRGPGEEEEEEEGDILDGDGGGGMTEEELDTVASRYFENEKSEVEHADHMPEDVSGVAAQETGTKPMAKKKRTRQAETDARLGRMVDVVLSDMCEPWEQTSGFFKRSLSDPYHRMMNTSGLNLRDHAYSMDLCEAALSFAYDALRTNGHFVVKFYSGDQDKELEKRLKALFSKVHRLKPDASRKESKEHYFVCRRRKPDVPRDEVFPQNGGLF